MFSHIQDMAREIRAAQIIQFGQFILKSGQTSSYYIDFRKILGHPKLFKQIGHQLAKLARPLDFNLLCGVPYAAIPMATSVGLVLEKPMLFCRKNPKLYGYKNTIEGIFSQGQNCLLIEDVVTSGKSVLETTDILKENGLLVQNCLCLVARQETGIENLRQAGITLHTLFRVEDLMDA